MKSTLVLMMLILLSTASGQQVPDKDPRVEAVVREISGSNIKRSVGTLVSFGTRHTLSDTVSQTRGIGAARRWIASEFQRYAKESGGRMTVEFHESIVPQSARIPSPTNVVNVVATLRGRQSGTVGAERLLVVGAHYDSRATDPLDATSDAPGANDDGSGTAVILELARVLSKQTFGATIVFIAFAGEEQGLLGAGRWAEMAKEKSWNVEAMLNNDMVGNTRGGDGKTDASTVRLYSEALT
ncbi:MAG: M28 family peptidase, partial [Bacteroidota bacterium]